MEIDQTGRTDMMHMFNEMYPRFADRLDVQKLMDRKRYIMRSHKLSHVEINEIRVQVQHELRLGTIRRSERESHGSNRNSARFSQIFSSNRTSLQNNNISHNIINENIVQDSNTQLFLDELANNMDIAITEFYETDPNCRKKLPRIKLSWKFNKLINLMNDNVLPNYVDNCEDLESLQYIVYCGAVATIRSLGLKVDSERLPKNAKPAWMNRLETRIAKLRASLGRLTMYRNGNRSLKLCRKITQIIKPVEIHNLSSNSLNEYIDTFTQKLSAIVKRLKRYKECTERKRQNNQFYNNEKQFYSQFKNNTPNFNNGVPRIEEITQFWANIWENPATHNVNGSWIADEISRCEELEKMRPTIITVEEIEEAIKRSKNWASPGPDFVQNIWYKKFTILHQKIAFFFNKILNDPNLLPEFMTQGITYLIPKDSNTTNPSLYRPITCLPCLYKMFTKVITTKIQSHLTENIIMTEEQKGSMKDTYGCKDQLIIDSVILGQATHKTRNLNMAYIDYKKAFDTIPHSYLQQILSIYKLDESIINLMCYAMKTWRTTMILNHNEGKLKSRIIYIRKGIFQGDSFSPLWFCMSLNPISRALKNIKWGYKIHHGTERHTITHNFYMDDLKLYASSAEELHRMLNYTKKMSDDIKMEFGIDKCKSVQLLHGKIIQTPGFRVDSNKIIEDLINGETYKYLGFLQLKQIQHSSIKIKLQEEFKSRVHKVFGTLLNSKNKIKALNTFAIPLLTYSFGIIKWSPTEMKTIATLVRTAMTNHRMHHRSSAVERVDIPRCEGGRGIIDVVTLCQSQIEQLRQYFVSNQNQLYKIICAIDDGYSALHLTDSNYGFYPEHPSFHEKVTRWKSKELHGAHPHQLDHEYVDKKASNEWLRRGELFAETEGFLIAIQDRIISTRNYRKYILKQDMPNDLCRKCNLVGETIEHIINGCSMLSSTAYTARHNNVAKIVHQNLAMKYKLIHEFVPYYKYNPIPVLENNDIKILWDRPIITDYTIPANRPDIVIYDKQHKKVQLVDVAIPLNHNIQTTFAEKITKYHDIAEEIKQMWGLDQIRIIPVIISSTGIIPQSLKQQLEYLDISHLDTYSLQKAVILSTCNIVRRFLNHHSI